MATHGGGTATHGGGAAHGGGTATHGGGAAQRHMAAAQRHMAAAQRHMAAAQRHMAAAQRHMAAAQRHMAAAQRHIGRRTWGREHRAGTSDAMSSLSSLGIDLMIGGGMGGSASLFISWSAVSDDAEITALAAAPKQLSTSS